MTANLVLHETIERIYVGDRYGDIERGIYLIRGENVVLLGEIVRPFLPHLLTHPPTHLSTHPTRVYIKLSSRSVWVTLRFCLLTHPLFK